MEAIAKAAGVTFKLNETASSILLRANRRAAAGAIQGAIDQIEALLPFVQPHFEVHGIAVSGRTVIGGAPFEVEDAVGRDSTQVGVDALGRPIGAVGAQVIPKSEDGVGKSRGRQTGIDIVTIGAGELKVAVGADPGAGEGLSVERVGERKRDGSSKIVPMVADVTSAGNDSGACGLGDGVGG